MDEKNKRKSGNKDGHIVSPNKYHRYTHSPSSLSSSPCGITTSLASTPITNVERAAAIECFLLNIKHGGYLVRYTLGIFIADHLWSETPVPWDGVPSAVAVFSYIVGSYTNQHKDTYFADCFSKSMTLCSKIVKNEEHGSDTQALKDSLQKLYRVHGVVFNLYRDIALPDIQIIGGNVVGMGIQPRMNLLDGVEGIMDVVMCYLDNKQPIPPCSLHSWHTAEMKRIFGTSYTDKGIILTRLQQGEKGVFFILAALSHVADNIVKGKMDRELNTKVHEAVKHLGKDTLLNLIVIANETSNSPGLC